MANPNPVMQFGAFTPFGLASLLGISGSQFNSSAVLNAAIPSGLLTGALEVILNTTANGANALSTPTAQQMIADIIAEMCPYLSPVGLVGMSYELTIQNTGNNTVTLTGGAGVTITGTNTIATGTWRRFVVTVTGATTITLQNIGSGAV